MITRVMVLAIAPLVLAACAQSGPPTLAVVPADSAHAFAVEEALAQISGLRIGTAATATHIVRIDASLTAVLTEAGAERKLWSQAFEGEVIHTSHEVARAIADQLSVTLTGDEGERLDNPGSADPAVVDEYIEGVGLLLDEDFEAAIASLRRTVQADSSFYRAYVRLAEAYLALGNRDLLAPEDAFTKARSFSLQALNLNDKFGPAHAALGDVTSVYLWRWQEAETHFERALAFSPGCMAAHRGYAGLLIKLRRFDEARGHAVPGQLDYFTGAGDSPFASLDPELHHYLRAAAQLRRGQHDEAMRLLSQAISARDPLLGYLAADPAFAPLHDHPRLPEMLDYLDLPMPE